MADQATQEPINQEKPPEPTPFEKAMFIDPLLVSVCFADVVMIRQALKRLIEHFIGQLDTIVMDPNIPPVQKQQSLGFVRQTASGLQALDQKLSDAVKGPMERIMAMAEEEKKKAGVALKGDLTALMGRFSV